MAFDSVAWEFMQKSLLLFQSGPSICKWVQIFSDGSEPGVLQNGNLPRFFKSHVENAGRATHSLPTFSSLVLKY